jgi:hypothetical protein
MTRRFILCWLAVFSTACSDSAPKPWNAAEMNELSELFGHIAEAYAVADVCIPMIDADKDARFRVTSKIQARHFTQLSQIDTEARLAEFFAHHRQNAGTDEQAAALNQIYRDSHAAAAQHLTSIDSCVETVTDYANTILNTKVSRAP